MKTNILIIILLILTSSRIFAQLLVNAGNDTIICYDDINTGAVVIGVNPTALGGIEPYIYTWTTNDLNSFGASYFLNDTTISNPKLVKGTFENLKFKLSVKDSVDNMAEDSIFVRISAMSVTMIYYSPTINQGDTIELFHNYVIGGIEPLKYTWYPNYNISDTTVSNPKAWPDTTFIYHVYATDSIGCISPTTESIVYVNPVGINSTEVNYHSRVFPNPIDNNSVINLNTPNQNKLTINFFNANGQMILTDKFSTNTYRIGDKIAKSGIYIYSICNGSEIVAKGQFIKE